MRKLLMLAFAPIRKNKSHSLSLLTLIMIASTLFYLGAYLNVNRGHFFEEKAKELNSPDVAVTIEETIYSQKDLNYFLNNPKVAEAETVKTTVLPNAQPEYAGSSTTIHVLLLDENNLGDMLVPNFVGKKLPVKANAIYLPYIFHTGGKLNLGDSFTLEYSTQQYQFTVAGFFEDIYFGTMNTGNISCILPNADSFLEKLDAPYKNATTILARTHNPKDAVIFNEYIADKMQKTDPTIYNESYVGGTWYQNCELATTLTINIASTLIILFSLIIVVVALVVVQFRITNSIEDSMTNIGALKATGYTSRQIMTGMSLQFLMITITGCALGLICAKCISPMLSFAFTMQNGLIWNMSFHIPVALLTVLCISASVILTSLWAALRIRRLHPIIALRSGMTTHSYKKNLFPLEKSKGKLNILLGLKTMGLKQSLSIAIICIVVTFASSIFIVLYYNVIGDNSVFFNLIVSENADVIVNIAPDTDPKSLLQEVKK